MQREGLSHDTVPQHSEPPGEAQWIKKSCRCEGAEFQVPGPNGGAVRVRQGDLCNLVSQESELASFEDPDSMNKTRDASLWLSRKYAHKHVYTFPLSAQTHVNKNILICTTHVQTPVTI